VSDPVLPEYSRVQCFSLSVVNLLLRLNLLADLWCPRFWQIQFPQQVADWPDSEETLSNKGATSSGYYSNEALKNAIGEHPRFCLRPATYTFFVRRVIKPPLL
jgi:hypothetical protein